MRESVLKHTGNHTMSEKKNQSRYSPEFVDSICERISLGEPLLTICKDVKVPIGTVHGWFTQNLDGSAEKYARARQARAEVYAEQIMEIVDEPAPVLENGATDSGYVADKRLRMDARKWIASKLLPRVYGERQVLAGDPDAPLVTTVTHLVDIAASLESARQIEVEDDNT